MEPDRQENNKVRPPALTILAIWYFALAVYNLIGIFGIATQSGGLFGIGEEISSAVGSWGDAFRLFVSLLYGLAALVVGFGLWTIRSWAWGAGLVMGILLLPGIPVGSFIGAVTIILLLKNAKIREAFRRE